MARRKISLSIRLVLVVAAGSLGIAQGAHAQSSPRMTARDRKDARPASHMRATTKAQREAARVRQAPEKTGVSQQYAGVNPASANHSPLVVRGAKAMMAAPNSMPDYFGVANWANSPLPITAGSGASVMATSDGNSVTGFTGLVGGSGYTYPYVTIDPPTSGCTIDGTTCIQATAAATEVGGVITDVTLVNGGLGYTTAPNVSLSGINPSSGMRKFVDTLPGLCGISPWGPTSNGVNDLGQCLPIAQKMDPPAGVPADADYYEIGLEDYPLQMHTDLPEQTKIRGYYDLNSADTWGPQYLGPVIIATRNRPVRVKFTNNLGVGALGNSFVPVDTTYMGAGKGPDGTMYTQNRAAVHLHGGVTPWISDGTPHQWITPVGETASLKSGASQRNVPDMFGGDPGAGSATFYWTNQQSGRLMFYHDHAYGITRLNVYAGEAAGYLIVDPSQETALGTATVPGTIVTDPSTGDIQTADLAHMVPLVIQDKSFVPDNGDPGGQLAATDPTWDVASYGGRSQLWFPHVYTPNQNPYDISGANPFGRWDYGPWFWPPQDPSTYVPEGQPKPCTSVAYPGAYLTCPGTPNPSGTPEGFMDTPVINGTAYPSLTVEQAAYRFQILSVGNDRALNLGLYYAADNQTGVVCKAGNVFTPANCTEVSMVPAVPHDTTTTPPLCTEVTDVNPGGMIARATIDPITGNPINGTGLPSGCWPTTWPTDGRDGGVPDPATAGPPIIQIGTEGGLLPKPAVIPSTPNGYEYNRRSITVLNVFTHGLILGPAERADVVVDFSSVPSGSVLILYNDGPAPIPAFDSRVDYYTGDPDQTSTGGAPTTLPGYGPNTRTLMQINVTGGSTNTVAFDLPTLASDLPGIFASTQDQIIVPEPEYPVGNGNSSQGNYVRIQDSSIAFFNGGGIGAVTLSPPNFGGGAYTSAPAVNFAGGGGSGAAATAILGPGAVRLVNLTSGGSGYTSAPAVTFSGGGGSGAAATAVLNPTTVATATVTAGGSGYLAAPTVTIAPPGCVINGTTCIQALATATVQANGQHRVTGITITNHGAGYSAVPGVTFTPTNGGSGATARANLAASSVASVSLTSGGSGYTSTPTVGFSGGGGTGASATAVTAQPVASIAVTAAGTGYTSAPTVTIDPPSVGKTATAVAGAPSAPLLRKTIQELFTLDYGRMNATLGVELPLTNFLTQTTIPYGYVDPPTEIFGDGETQYWKITHNGVDTHFIHVHLFTAQVINRVGWDGAVKPPDDNELGWKDTIRMNPLEDIIIALRPIKPSLPWDLPNSVRPLDTTMPVGASLPNEFTTADPTNQPVTVVNDMTNFGWEYVWHCHILGHEENDMMRAMVFGVPPIAPSNLATAAGGRLTWTDNSLNETGFTIQRASSAGGPWTSVATVAAVPGSGTTLTYKSGSVIKSGFYYQVVADNVVGYTRAFAAPAVGWEHPDYPSAPSNAVMY